MQWRIKKYTACQIKMTRERGSEAHPNSKQAIFIAFSSRKLLHVMVNIASVYDP